MLSKTSAISAKNLTDATLIDSAVIDQSGDILILADCPVCGDRSTFRWRFEKKERQFYQCLDCHTEKQFPLPTIADLQAYYDAEFDHGMYETFTSAEQMKVMTAQRRMKEISPYIERAGRWLDVGCANGVFVAEAAKRERVDAEGIELSAVAVKQATDEGLNVRCGALEDVEAEEVYDCITAFDVVEHVIDPKEFVQDIADRLKPGGYAAITLPNRASIFRKIMGKRWWFYIPEEHLHYFDFKSISQLFKNAGLEPVNVSRTYKPLTYNYGLTQFVEFNPGIYKFLNGISPLIPNRLREWILPFYIGEMKLIARKPG